MQTPKCLIIEKTGHSYYCRFELGQERSLLRELANWVLNPDYNLGVNELVEATMKIKAAMKREKSHEE